MHGQGEPRRGERDAATRRRRWDDRGAGTIEYQGILVVGALLVVAVVGAALAFPGMTESAVCRVKSAFEGGGACGAVSASGEAPTDEDLRPGVCMLSETSQGGGVGVDIGFVKLGTDWGLQVTEYGGKEGEVHATVTNGASAGLQAKVEGEAGAVGASASASVEGTYQHGDTWIVPTEEWPAFKENAEAYFSQSKWRWIGAGTLWGAREPRAPDVTSHRGGATAQVGVNAAVGMESTVEGEDRPGALTVASASAQASAGVTVTREHNALDDTVTWTYAAEGSASAQATVLVGGVGAQASRTGALSVTYDAQMRVRSLSFSTTERAGAYAAFGLDVELETQPPGRHSKPNTYSPSGGGSHDPNDLVVTTTTLDVTRDNRELVEGWLDERFGGAAAELPLTPVVPSSPAPDDAMMQLLYESGKTSRNVYAATDSSGSVGVGVSAGVGGGVEISGTQGERTVRDGQFLGSPREDGVRPFLPNAACG